MIDSLYLKHFKCFDDKQIPLNRLTVLCGQNSAGKSTLIQAISALMQTAVESRYSSQLTLNGQYISLGSFSDVINIHKGRDEFSIGITVDGDEIRWTFSGEAGSLSGAKIKAVKVENKNYTATELDKIRLDCLTPILSEITPLVSRTLLNVTHLTADRKAGHELHHFFERRTNAIGDHRIDVGAHGEAAMSLLMTEGDRTLSETDPRLLPGESRTLFAQSRAWMQILFPGSSVDALPIESSSFFRLRFQTNPTDRFRRPESVGFGYSQVFPIVVLGLAATEKNTLLIENPEVHLHPSAQSKVGRFFARCASAGAQVITETHSDHIINGIRREVASRREIANDVTIYSVYSETDSPGESELDEILIDESGRLSNWPEGFFDQATEDARSLVLGS